MHSDVEDALDWNTVTDALYSVGSGALPAIFRCAGSDVQSNSLGGFPLASIATALQAGMKATHGHRPGVAE